MASTANKLFKSGTFTKNQNDPFNVFGMQEQQAAEARAIESKVAAQNATANLQLEQQAAEKENAAVLTGGSADVADTLRKKKTAGLSSQLGINV